MLRRGSGSLLPPGLTLTHPITLILSYDKTPAPDPNSNPDLIACMLVGDACTSLSLFPPSKQNAAMQIFSYPYSTLPIILPLPSSGALVNAQMTPTRKAAANRVYDKFDKDRSGTGDGCSRTRVRVRLGLGLSGRWGVGKLFPCTLVTLSHLGSVLSIQIPMSQGGNVVSYRMSIKLP